MTMGLFGKGVARICAVVAASSAREMTAQLREALRETPTVELRLDWLANDLERRRFLAWIRRNCPKRAVLLAKDTRIEPIDLPFDSGAMPEGSAVASGWDVPPNMTLEDIERLVIERTLQRTGGNKQAAANLLGIYRPRLYSKIRKYNIDVGSLVSA